MQIDRVVFSFLSFLYTWAMGMFIDRVAFSFFLYTWVMGMFIDRVAFPFLSQSFFCHVEYTVYSIGYTPHQVKSLKRQVHTSTALLL